MNKQRREELSKILCEIEGLKSRLETVRDEEQDYFDNMPAGLKSSDKGSAAEEACSELESAVAALEDACSAIEDASGD